MTDMALHRCQQLQIKLQAVRAAHAAKAAAEGAAEGGPVGAGATPGAAHTPSAGPATGDASVTGTGGEVARAVREAAAGEGAADEALGPDGATGDSSADAGRPEEVALKQEQLEEELEFLTKQGEMSEALATLDESLALKMALLQQQEMSAYQGLHPCGLSASAPVPDPTRLCSPHAAFLI
jgi:hypothetical protein